MKSFHELTKEERSNMTSSFLEKAMKEYDSDRVEEEEFHQSESTGEAAIDINVEEIFMESSTKFIEWKNQYLE